MGGPGAAAVSVGTEPECVRAARGDRRGGQGGAGGGRSAAIRRSASRRFFRPSQTCRKARNDGIVHAAGEIVAFLDDDAVPEPTWARRHVAAFAHARTRGGDGPGPGAERHFAAMGPRGGGPAGARHRGRMIRTAIAAGTVLKLHGTNMALRRVRSADTLGRLRSGVSLLSRRYGPVPASRRCRTPGVAAPAQVHHEFAASTRRTADRVPLSLFDIGASTAVFLRKHAPDEMDDGPAPPGRGPARATVPAGAQAQARGAGCRNADAQSA
jgi:glycosyltransferase involved in cell wall biosynthesis